MQSMSKMVFRRLMLRKGVALLLALVFVVSTVGLYIAFVNVTTDLPTADRQLQPAEDVSKSSSPPDLPPTTATFPQTREEEHASTFETSLPASPARRGSLANSTADECVFSSAQPKSPADIEMTRLFDTLPFDNPDGGVWKQGYDITYKMASFDEHPLEVFIVPHSHNDPGWLKTFEDYYTSQTRSILTLITDALAANSKRRFIWAEISYLDLWWQEQGRSRRDQFRKLVENGQMEIVTGGWVMTDEANSYYYAMIDQLIEGHSWIKQNLPGVTPHSGWSIDPFGYNPTLAYILGETGMHNMVIQRVHYAIKKHLAINKALEFGWRQLWDHSKTTDIFCHLMPFYSYDIPHTCGPDPKICCQFDFKRIDGNPDCPWGVRPEAITDGNVVHKAEMLADQYRKKAQLFRTNVLLVPLGDDFRYDNQREVNDQYTNYERLIGYINSHPEMKMKVQFGTLTEFFKALRKHTGTTEHQIPAGFPIFSGDFFTYCDREMDYWSGYYTSRPFHKRMDRVLETNLRVAEVLYSVAVAKKVPMDPSTPVQLTKARRNLGLFQHHDGITGTAKNHVVMDYTQRLTYSITAMKKAAASSAQSLLLAPRHNPGSLIFDIEEIFPAADSLPQKIVIDIGATGRTVVIFNSLPHSRHQVVLLRVNSHKVLVKDAVGTLVPCQLSPVWSKENTISSEEFEVVFVASLGALGFATYQLVPADKGAPPASVELINHSTLSAVFQTQAHVGGDITLTTSHLTASFSPDKGLLQHVEIQDLRVDISADLVMYQSKHSGNEKSGAYLFLPEGEAHSIVQGQKPAVMVTKGALMQEVCTVFSVITHCVQVFESPGVEGKSLGIKNTVDIRQEMDKELAMRFATSVHNMEGVYYTDLNGFQLVRRRTVSKLPLQGNVYPMPSAALLQDRSVRITLFTAQPLGVSSLKQGWLEVMLDRRLSQDDSRGLGQGVTDNLYTREMFKLLVEERKHKTAQPSNLTATLAYPSLLGHHTSDVLLHPLQTLVVKPSYVGLPLFHTHSLLTSPFPCDLHLVNLRSITDSDPPTNAAMILHRRGFDCGYETEPLTCSLEGGKLSLSNIFSDFSVTKAVSTSLSLLHEYEPLPTLSLHVPPMEVQTYKLSW